MKFIVEREQLLKPLQQVSGPLGGRPTLPILGNLLLQVNEGTLLLTGTVRCGFTDLRFTSTPALSGSFSRTREREPLSAWCWRNTCAC